jgi:hypothetical protein
VHQGRERRIVGEPRPVGQPGALNAVLVRVP